MNRFLSSHRDELMANPEWQREFERAIGEIMSEKSTSSNQSIQYFTPKRFNQGRRFDNYVNPNAQRRGLRAGPSASMSAMSISGQSDLSTSQWPRRESKIISDEVPIDAFDPAENMYKGSALPPKGIYSNESRTAKSANMFNDYSQLQEMLESRQLSPMSGPTAPTALSPRSAFKLQSGIRMNRAKDDDE